MMETGIGPAVLTEKLRDMTADEAVKMTRELCAQLDGDAESFHGNIWPGNVRLDGEGKAVLGESSDAPVNERAAEQVEFLAPEYFWDNIGSAAADVYSLGLLLYAGCNGGYMPFQPKGGALTDKDRSGALRKRMKGERIGVPAGVSPELGAVISRALAYEPEERYISAAELLTALGAADEALPVPAAAAVPPQTADEAEEPAPEDAADAPDAAAAEVQPEASAQETDEEEQPVGAAETAEAAPVPEETAQAPENAEAKPVPEARTYTVQKDFEKGARREPSAAPATMRKEKKRISPVIVFLCVAAVAVIAAVAVTFLGGNGEQEEEVQTVSAPYVISASEAPDATEAPSPSTIPSLDDEPEEEKTPADEDEGEPAEEAVTGSATVDGREVTPVSDTVYATGTGVNLRTGPSTIYDIAGSVPRGTALTRTGTVSGWSQVQYDGEEYYVSNSLISATDPNGTSADDAGTGTSTGTGTAANNTSTGSAGTGTGNTGTTTGGTGTVNTGTNTGSAAAAAAPAVTATRDIVTVTTKANLRSGAGTNYTILGVADVGAVLQRTGTVSGWSRVVYDGKEAYIYDSLISAVSASTVTDAVGTLRVTEKVNVRSGAGTSYDILGVADVGTTLPITGLADGKWYRVSYNGAEGYVNRNLISVRDFALVNEESGSVRVTSAANIRSGPGTDYEILGTAAAGDTLTITGHTDSNWYEVTYNGGTAYIAGNLAQKSA